MEERDRIRYETLFYCQKLENGFLSGDTARALFIRSKLPLLDLTRIWKLSDLTRDNRLDVFEFSLAMHFIELKLMGDEIPKQHDITNVDNDNEVVIPKFTLEEKQQMKDIFEHADTNSQTFLERNIVKPMMSISGLSPPTLSKIWYIADLDRDGRLCLFEFFIALHVVKNCVKGLNLNGPVNPFACFPDEDDAVRLYKEKLVIFDKEFLLKQTQDSHNEDEMFLSPTDSADSSPDFELLTAYLFDGQCVSNLGKLGPDFADESLNNFPRKEEKVFVLHDHKQPNGLANSDNCVSVVEEAPAVDCTETIERHEINKDILNVDLEDIFETVSKENMDECEDTPKFTAKLPLGSATTEEDEDEIPPVLPLYQKRAYLGKDLVFEDPIGNDVIGDVEFEVDFEYIISDIEKEIVDEERRLPIARVLPIYKLPPDAEEQPLKLTVTAKESQEIDLNFIDMKGDSLNEQKAIGLITRENQIFINAVTKESNTSGKGVDSNEDNLNCVQSVDNLDKVSSAVDIVEQKRLLMESQQEERRRLRENQTRNKENKEEVSGLVSSVAVVGNAKQFGFDKITDDKSQEMDTETPKNLHYNNNYLGMQRKGNQSIVEGDDIMYKTSDSEQDNKNGKEPNQLPESSVARIVQSSENEAYVKSDNESKYENEEEEERLREAADKEKRLLERINFLEKKRQLLYEKKQREFNMNNVNPKQDDLASTVNERRGQEKLSTIETHRDNQQQNAMSASLETWGSKQHRKEVDESEKKKLAEALAAKRKSEAELEQQRQEVLRAAEKRKLEEETKIREEHEAAKERRQNFLENLKKLKERVLIEEEEKYKVSNNESRGGTGRSVHSTGARSSVSHFNKPHEYLPVDTKMSTMSEGTVSSNANQNTNAMRYEAVERRTVKHDTTNLETEEEQKKAEEMRLENFKSNRELFMRKIQTEAEQSAELQKREKSKKVRPKSYYGGMFKKPVQKIIDDSLLAQNVDSRSVEDLVDKEALKQFEREQELKKEHEKIDKLRHSLERESSYTVENVEKLFEEAETENKTTKQAGNDWDSLEWKETKASSNPRRRSLVNTLTSEWNSFIDVLGEDKRRESETVKIGKEISAQRKVSPAPTSVTKPVSLHVDVVKNDSSKDIIEEKEMFTKQAGKVKKLVTSYKRLSMPCFLDHVDKWNFEKSGGEAKTFETNVQTGRPSTSSRQGPDDKKFDQKSIIKQNTPKRKTNLADAWTHRIANQEKAD